MQERRLSGRMLQTKRENAGISRAVLSRWTEIPYNTIRGWERDKRTSPPKHIFLLIDFYKVKFRNEFQEGNSITTQEVKP